jgi:hypothetical protein
MLHVKRSRLVNRYGENDQSTTENNELLNKVDIHGSVHRSMTQ